MRLRIVLLAGIAVAGCSVASFSQVSGSGTPNRIPKFTGSSTIGDSTSINEVNGNVGIGTSSPSSKLDVEGGSITIGNGVLHLAGGGDGTSPPIHFFTTAPAGFNPGGNLGLWLSSDFSVHLNAAFNIALGSVSGNSQVYNALTLQPAGGSAFGANGASLLLSSVTNHGITPIAGIWSSLGSGGNGGVNYDGSLVFGSTRQNNSGPTEGMRLDQYGNLGIGTSTPGARLDVNGSVKLSGSGASMSFPDGTVQATAWNGTTCGGDYAESVDVAGDRAAYEPGDVLVIDPTSPDKFLRTAEPYSPLVAGIYSTQPGLTGRRKGAPKTGEEIPMALVGIVPTKVSAENGPIKPGTLLVTSSTAGYAMRGTDREKLTGAIIGKAMGTLDSGKGVIEVLVSLQ